VKDRPSVAERGDGPASRPLGLRIDKEKKKKVSGGGGGGGGGTYRDPQIEGRREQAKRKQGKRVHKGGILVESIRIQSFHEWGRGMLWPPRKKTGMGVVREGSQSPRKKKPTNT